MLSKNVINETSVRLIFIQCNTNNIKVCYEISLFCTSWYEVKFGSPYQKVRTGGILYKGYSVLIDYQEGVKKLALNSTFKCKTSRVASSK